MSKDAPKRITQPLTM